MINKNKDVDPSKVAQLSQAHKTFLSLLGQLGVSMINKNKDVDPSKVAQLSQAHKTFLEKRPYETFTEEEVAEADVLLKKEFEAVKTGMGHGELSIDSYTQVWEECYAQVTWPVYSGQWLMCTLFSYF